MARQELAPKPIEEPLARLERELIGAFIAGAGFDIHDLWARDDVEAHALLLAASRYASERLSEVEARSRYLHRLRGEQ